MALTHTPKEMFNNIDYASGRGDRLSGRVDAVAHVGKLMQGEWTEEFVADLQAANLDETDAEPAYIAGYEEAWNAIFNLIYGLQPNELHKQLGPFV
ncbi:Hypothetical Protein OBI_RACECAR_300 [Arthrobacter phage Racecar]|nr:hypothetical protein PBI_RACECAR_92 [Arthrobacter phage Racecar]